ncbi:MAG: hypothetical protein EB084_14010 [Proteobacteria bacterium]|nr:hypothetical protein [Pseudomonadota bacterium]
MKFRSERERRIVIWGGLTGFLLLWWSFFVQPSMRLIQSFQQRDIPNAKRAVERARTIAGELGALQAKPTSKPSGTSIALTIDDIVRKRVAIPANHIKNIQDVGKGAQIKLSDIDGGTLMRLLHALEEAGIRPDDADFHDLTGKSLFDVTITVNGPAGAAP